MSRFFNTSGPIRPEKHYSIPVAQRIDLDEIMTLIDQEKYFVLHAPRQSGKTTALLEIMRKLNASGQYHCLYVNVEPAQTARENIERAMKTISSELLEAERNHLPGQTIIADHYTAATAQDPGSSFKVLLSAWARQSPRPTVLLIDEIDSLIGDTLVSVLRQLRGGYADRPKNFPQSVILCGVRDIRDYRIHASREKEVVTGGSCFNISSESLRIGNFSEKELRDLYLQHTSETGQVFADEALALAYELTCGQPWLVNALAFEACFKIPRGKDRTQPITADLIREAKENLIQRRATHLDQLVDKLKEPRVRALVEPLLQGTDIEKMPPDDLQYAVDLGLLKVTRGKVSVANPIYQEVIPRELNYMAQINLGSRFEPEWYRASDGSLNLDKLLTDFQQFFRENSESWVERFDYKEAGPQLLLQAFLQRILNGGGSIHREYGLARGRTDLLVEWKKDQRFVLELKILHKSLETTMAEGLEQTWGYMDKTGTSVGHLLIFDRSSDKSWDQKVFKREISHKSKVIVVWGM